MHILLSREEFRNGVFQRDNHKCVVCGSANVRLDAHHILERRLWDDGGYYLANGATLCGVCHIQAEETTISCDRIREAAGIKDVLIPSHLYRDNVYDKWGNIINPNGTRLRGELFLDESVQKILNAGKILSLFTPYVKYSRTYHLPWSPGLTNDDRVLEDTTQFDGKEVVITEKMDGENTTIYHDYIHARSIDSDNHLSREWVKNFHAQIKWLIPEGWRIVGENMFAKHSISYSELPSYFLAFSIWDENNVCQSWKDTVIYTEVLGIETVPVIYSGIWDMSVIKNIETKMDFDRQEGYVVRMADAFSYGNFRRSVAKFVRSGHISTTHHWKRQMIVKNGLKI